MYMFVVTLELLCKLSVGKVLIQFGVGQWTSSTSFEMCTHIINYQDQIACMVKTNKLDILLLITFSQTSKSKVNFKSPYLTRYSSLCFDLTTKATF